MLIQGSLLGAQEIAEINSQRVLFNPSLPSALMRTISVRFYTPHPHFGFHRIQPPNANFLSDGIPCPE